MGMHVVSACAGACTRARRTSPTARCLPAAACADARSRPPLREAARCSAYSRPGEAAPAQAAAPDAAMNGREVRRYVTQTLTQHALTSRSTSAQSSIALPSKFNTRRRGHVTPEERVLVSRAVHAARSCRKHTVCQAGNAAAAHVQLLQRRQQRLQRTHLFTWRCVRCSCSQEHKQCPRTFCHGRPVLLSTSVRRFANGTPEGGESGSVKRTRLASEDESSARANTQLPTAARVAAPEV